MQSGGSQQKVPDLNCEVQDLLLQVVDLKQEVADLRSGGIPQWRIAVNFRQGVRQSVAFLSVHSPSRPYNQKTS